MCSKLAFPFYHFQVTICLIAIICGQTSSCDLCQWLLELIQHFLRCSTLTCRRCTNAITMIAVHIQQCSDRDQCTLCQMYPVDQTLITDLVSFLQIRSDDVRRTLQQVPALMLNFGFRSLAISEHRQPRSLPGAIPERKSDEKPSSLQFRHTIPKIGEQDTNTSDPRYCTGGARPKTHPQRTSFQAEGLTRRGVDSSSLPRVTLRRQLSHGPMSSRSFVALNNRGTPRNRDTTDGSSPGLPGNRSSAPGNNSLSSNRTLPCNASILPSNRSSCPSNNSGFASRRHVPSEDITDGFGNSNVAPSPTNNNSQTFDGSTAAPSNTESNRPAAPNNALSNQYQVPSNNSSQGFESSLRSMVEDKNLQSQRERVVLDSGCVYYGSVEDAQNFLVAIEDQKRQLENNGDTRTEGVIYCQFQQVCAQIPLMVRSREGLEILFVPLIIN